MNYKINIWIDSNLSFAKKTCVKNTILYRTKYISINSHAHKFSQFSSRSLVSLFQSLPLSLTFPWYFFHCSRKRQGNYPIDGLCSPLFHHYHTIYIILSDIYSYSYTLPYTWTHDVKNFKYFNFIMGSFSVVKLCKIYENPSFAYIFIYRSTAHVKYTQILYKPIYFSFRHLGMCIEKSPTIHTRARFEIYVFKYVQKNLNFWKFIFQPILRKICIEFSRLNLG